jgi:hypothetical protein
MQHTHPEDKELTTMAEAAAAPARVEGRTGAKCQKAGPYRSNTNAKVIIFVKQGDTFLADSNGVSTTWVLLTDADRW